MSKQFQIGLFAIVFLFILLACWAVWKKQQTVAEAPAIVIEEIKPVEGAPAATGK